MLEWGWKGMVFIGIYGARHSKIQQSEDRTRNSGRYKGR